MEESQGARQRRWLLGSRLFCGNLDSGCAVGAFALDLDVIRDKVGRVGRRDDDRPAPMDNIQDWATYDRRVDLGIAVTLWNG